ncbi:hypothetical protein VB773_02615 [Haloarculaceae archaeon H-GB2-1]|nr:hypothetical protein [Haloarculaceae archaeon H-GB1-1]MEA5406581.1 hypothetical protein [Haloarculaceae archaeon H-GB2-1]
MNHSGWYRFAPIVLFVLGILLAGGGVGAVTAADGQNATGPAVEIFVDGTLVADGERIDVDSSIPVRVNASVPANTSTNVTIAEVTLQVNDTLVYHSNASVESVSVLQSADLSPGENRVTVEVEDSRGAVTTQTITVYRDETPPQISLTEPAELTDDTPSEGTVVRTPVTFSGTITDDTDFSHGQIRVFNPSNDYRTRVDIEEANFSKSVLLGRDANTVVISATDEQGNTRTKRASLQVTDSVEPNVTVNEPGYFVHRKTFTVRATVTDNVWLNRAAVEVAYLNAPGNKTNQRRVYVPVTSRPYNVSTDRQRVNVTQKIELDRGFNLVTVRGIDHRRHTGQKSFVVEHYPDENGPPSIEVSTNGSFWVPPNQTDAVKKNASFWTDEKRASLWVNESYSTANGTFLLDARVVDEDHDLDHVTLEVRRRDGDNSRVLTRTFDARGRQRYRVFTQLPLKFGSYLVQVRVVDRRGESTTTAFELGPPPTEMEFLEDPTDLPTTTPSNETTQAGTTTTPNATATVTETAAPESGADAGGSSFLPSSTLYLVGYVVALLVVVAGIFAVVFARR